MSSILAVYVVAGRVPLKDARRMYGRYIDETSFSPEEMFVRDLLLHSGDVGRFQQHWMGGRKLSDRWTAHAYSEQAAVRRHANLKPPTAADPTAVRQLASVEVNRLIAALAHIVWCAHSNDFPPLATVANELVRLLSVKLAATMDRQAEVTEQDLASTAALLDRTANLLASGQWRPPNDLDVPLELLVDALRRDAALADPHQIQQTRSHFR